MEAGIGIVMMVAREVVRPWTYVESRLQTLEGKLQEGISTTTPRFLA